MKGYSFEEGAAIDGGGGMAYGYDPVPAAPVTATPGIEQIPVDYPAAPSQLPTQAIAPVPPAQAGTAIQSSVRAAIFEQGTNAELFGVTVTLLDGNGNPVASPVTMAADSNTFTTWTDRPDEDFVLFQKNGYGDTMVSFSALMANPQVFMPKLSASAGFPWWVLLLLIPFFLKKKKKVGKIQMSDVTIALTIGAGLIGFDLIKKMLTNLGIWTGAGSTAVQNEQSDPGSAWKPDYYKQFTSYTYSLTSQQAGQYAQTIHNAFSLWQDDYNAVFGVFSAMKTKANVSFLADIFSQQYNEDLLTFLTNGGGILPWDGLSETHLKTITDLVASLPSH